MKGRPQQPKGRTVVAALLVFLAASALARVPAGSAAGPSQRATDTFSGNSLVIQPDGKIIVAGGSSGFPGSDFALARYKPNGSLDPTFSHDGRKTTDFGGDDFAAGVALQGDGKIVVVGRTSDGGGDFALARYKPNGSLDPTFSHDGRKTTDFGGKGVIYGDRANGVAIGKNGEIAVAGGPQFKVALYRPNGALDKRFSDDGKRIIPRGFEEATGVVVQPNGRIVAAGYGGGFALARFKPNGSLDRTFSGDGKQTTECGCVASGVALQRDGRIVLAGQAATGPAPWGDFALARYKPNGSLDPTFSHDGRKTTDFGGYDGANGVAIGENGKIAAAGFGRTGGGDFALARYKPNGSLDPTFSHDGRKTTDFGGYGGAAQDVAIQMDRKIVAVGGGGPDDAFVLVRYKPNGSLDPTFSVDGKQTTR